MQPTAHEVTAGELDYLAEQWDGNGTFDSGPFRFQYVDRFGTQTLLARRIDGPRPFATTYRTVTETR